MEWKNEKVNLIVIEKMNFHEERQDENVNFEMARKKEK